MLTTLQRVKKQLGDTLDDETLTFYILAASQAIESYCRRSFKRQTYTEIIDGTGSPFLVVRNFPVHSGTARNEDKEIAFQAAEDGIIFLPQGWNKGLRNITVTYDAGYVLPGDATPDQPRTLPEAIEIACLFITQGMTQNPSNVQSERVGDISVTYRDADAMYTPTVQALLDPYVGRVI
ncbi:Phage gp6-like head-tail connector protein [compost metagenome]